jgi:hypothetical protein
MAHVELSLSDLGALAATADGPDASLVRWAAAVSFAAEPCLLLDDSGVVMAASRSCAALFSVPPEVAVGRHLLAGVMRLLDFNTVSGELPDWEADKIPPLLAAASGGLARGLMRVRDSGGSPRTVDAVSTPLRAGSVVAGSLTFFAAVSR